MKQPLVRRTLASLTAIALGLTGAIAASAPAAAAEAAATLVAHFPLTETSGTVAVDASGSGRDGTYVGAPALTGGEECDSTAPTIT
nr:hypothetical protein GCM10025699_00670 [Microbacterium flavescens]